MRAFLAGLGVAACAALLWHARPVLVWHWTVLPEIERVGRSARVHLDTLSRLPEPDPGWPRFQSRTVTLRAPLRAGQREACGACDRACAIELESGRLTVFDSSLPASHSAAIDAFAPSAEDVSIWRVAPDNWRTVEALAARASLRAEPPEAFRFDARRSQGIVTRFQSEGVERFVIYAFSREGLGGRVLALSRTGPEVLRKVLGGLEVADAALGAGCDGGG